MTNVGPDPILQVEKLTKRFGGLTAVDAVSFSLTPGEILGIIGPNGSGKTTLFSLMSGVLMPDSGTVTLDGTDTTKKRPAALARMGLVPVQSGRICFDGDVTALPAERRSGLGIVLSPEGRRLFPEMSVDENLIAGAHLASGWAEVRQRLEEVRSIFPKLRARADQTAQTLSGGEQQMVAIGRALMAKPRLLLLDEPSLGLAPIIVDELFRTLKAVHDKGLTIALVEQNVLQSLELAQNAHVLESGRLRMPGPAKDVLEDPYIKTACMGL